MKPIQTLLTKNHITSEYLCPKAQATAQGEEGTVELGTSLYFPLQKEITNSQCK